MQHPNIEPKIIQAGHLYAAMGNVRTGSPDSLWLVASNTVKDGQRESYSVASKPVGDGLTEWTCTCKASEFAQPTRFDLAGKDGQGQICKHIAATAIAWIGGLEDQPRSNLFGIVQQIIDHQAVYLEPGEQVVFYDTFKIIRENDLLHLKKGHSVSGPVGILLDNKWCLHEKALTHYEKFVEGLQ
jgi:hypothetical protein